MEDWNWNEEVGIFEGPSGEELSPPDKDNEVCVVIMRERVWIPVEVLEALLKKGQS